MFYSTQKTKKRPNCALSCRVAPFRKCQHFLSQNNENIGGGPFREKSLNTEKKRKGGPFGIFQHPFCCKILKKLKGTLWRKKIEKSHNAEKLKGDPLGFLNIHSVAKHQKLKGPFGEKFLFLQKKSHNAEKN